MPHNGTIDYGQEISVVIPDTPTISVVHLEEVSFAKAVKADTLIRNVSLMNLEPFIVVTPSDDVIDVQVINDGTFDVQIVTYTPTLSAYDLALLDMYAAYGTSYDAKLVFGALSKLVNVDLYKGTNGITT